MSSSDGGVTWTATLTPDRGITDATNLITLDNTGVTDAAGNAGSGTTNSNNYAIDTVNPAVVSVTASDAVISDVDVGTGTFTIAVAFSEAMNPAVTPTLIFSPSVTGTLTQNSSMWTGGDTVYTVSYNVADLNVVANGVTVDVTGAQDANGNAQLDYTPLGPSSRSTPRNPTATVDITAIVTDTGASSSDFITNDTSLTVSGTNTGRLARARRCRSAATAAPPGWMSAQKTARSSSCSSIRARTPPASPVRRGL